MKWRWITTAAWALAGSQLMAQTADLAATKQVADDADGASRAGTQAAPRPGQTNELRLDFRGAPLGLVLDFMSEAAGFIINKECEVKGTVDMWSKTLVSREEAAQLLNAALKKNGYAMIRNGRILTILPFESAKTADVEIATGAVPDEVAASGELLTQVIPVRFAIATQLLNNLQVLLPTTATLSVNESANSLILVAAGSDVRRILKIVHTLDTSLSRAFSIRVFVLQHADANQLAVVIQQLFGSQNPSPTGRGVPGQMNPGIFVGPGGQMGPGGGPFPGSGPMVGGGGGGASGASSGPNAAATRVVATSDETANALIVSASPELIATVSGLVKQLDLPVADLTEIRVFQLRNSDAAELAEQLGQLFPDESRSSRPDVSDFRFEGGPFREPPGQFDPMADGDSANNSPRSRKMSRVLAVPDPRTSSLIVAASTTLMPQIAEMIQALDSSTAGKELVSVWDLHNVGPTHVNRVLQDLFNRNTTMRNNSANRNSLADNDDPLSSRMMQQEQDTGPQGFGNAEVPRNQDGGFGF